MDRGGLLMKIMTWNIKGEASLGWNNLYEIKRELVDKVIEQKADVIVLTAFVIAKGIDYLFESLQNEGYIWFQQSRSGKNGILIALKRELIKDKELIDRVYNKDIISSVVDGCNILRVIVPLVCGKNLCVIGCRMETGGRGSLEEQYNLEKEHFENILIPTIQSIEHNYLHILCGDFNNAKYYGELEKTFEEVKEKYKKQEWNNAKNRYEGPSLPVAQYNYNLHIIKDLLKKNGLELCEKENDWTYKHLIHNDHIFVKGLTYVSSGIIENNLSDHNILWSEVKLEN